MTHTTQICSNHARGRSVSFHQQLFLPLFFFFFFIFFPDQRSIAQGKNPVFTNSPQARTLAPTNDNCGTAQSVTPNGTCYSGTTVGADDSWVGTVGCQSGNNHPDVWYTFVATGSSLAINITAGTLGGNIEFVLVSSTSSCSGLSV